MAGKRRNPPVSRGPSLLFVRLRTRSCPWTDIDRKPRSAEAETTGYASP